MPWKCVAPECKTNYDSEDPKKSKVNDTSESDSNDRNCKTTCENETPQTSKDDDASESNSTGHQPPQLHLFKFPDKEKEPERRSEWISKVPRADWTPENEKKLYLCELHFQEEDIIRYSTDSNARRKRKKTTAEQSSDGPRKLERPRLKPGAFPRIWPGAEHLSKVTAPRPTAFSSSEARQQIVDAREEAFRIEEEKKDTFSSLSELDVKIVDILPNDITKFRDENYSLFVSHVITDLQAPHVKYSVKIDVDLKYDVYYEGDKVNGVVLKSIIKEKFGKISGLKLLFDYLENCPQIEETQEEIIGAVIEKLKDSKFDGNKKVGFLIEQLSLMLKTPTGRRYSPSLLAVASLRQRGSPALYKQIYQDNFLTLPSPDYVRRLSSSIDVNCMSLTPSTIAYLKARFSKIKDKDKVVSLLMDEVYSHQDVQYVNGNFFGYENEQLTKTMLCLMIKSIAGKYRDIISMVPIVNINAEKLYEIWKSTVSAMTKVGFDIAVTMTDGHSSNMKLFNTKILGKDLDKVFVENPDSPGSNIYLMYDPVHLFKNFYNNWTKKINFDCPTEDLKGTLEPNFLYLQQLYDIEKTISPKMAHKLSEKVLRPQSIEKTSVKLADSAFHESTIAGLRYYAKHGHDYFLDTAIFIQRIRNWFNKFNVKSEDYGRRKRDEMRNPIRRETVENDLKSIEEFHTWLETWKKSCPPSVGLSNETFECAIRTCRATVQLAEYLFEKYPELDFILLGNICSDYLEGRFG